MSERWRKALLVGVAVFVYANTLLNLFTLDDNIYVLSNPIANHFTLRGIFEPTAYNNVFRPLYFASLALNWAIGGNHPFGYHLVDLLLHAAVTVLLYLALRGLLEAVPRGDLAAWIAALLFAVHPIHTEAVASIAGRSEGLAMGFLLGAWLLHLSDRPILALVSFVLALLAKESSVAFLPLVIAGDYARGKFQPVWRYAAIATTAVAYLGLLWKVQGGRFGEKWVNFLDNPLVYLPASLRIPNALRIAWKVVWLHIYPARLSCDYSYNAILLYSNWHRNALAIAGAVGVLALWFWALWAKRKEWFLAGAIYLLGFAATANILVPTGTILGERLAYLPSAGFCLLVALLWIQLENKQRRLAWTLLAVIVVALGTRTILRNRDWHDNFTLFSAAVKAAPGSAKAHSNLGLQYYYRGQLDEAGRELDTALRIYPELGDAIGCKGLIASRRGDDAEARRLLEKALTLTLETNPNYDFIAVNLAAVEMKMGQKDDALKILDQEIEESPRSSRAWSNRAVLRYQKGDMASARSDAEAALRLDSSNTQAKNLLAILSGAVTPSVE